VYARRGKRGMQVSIDPKPHSAQKETEAARA